jgi:hypothetical protein
MLHFSASAARDETSGYARMVTAGTFAEIFEVRRYQTPSAVFRTL